MPRWTARPLSDRTLKLANATKACPACGEPAWAGVTTVFHLPTEGAGSCFSTMVRQRAKNWRDIGVRVRPAMGLASSSSEPYA